MAFDVVHVSRLFSPARIVLETGMRTFMIKRGEGEIDNLFQNLL